MLNRRQKLLLALLVNAPCNPTKIQFMKWLFLLHKETGISQKESFYNFVPYKYGPFSFTAYHEIDKLHRRGLLSSGEELIECVAVARAHWAASGLSGCALTQVRVTLSRYGRMSQGKLIDYVYEHYPWYASRSELRQSKWVEAATRAPSAIYTFGYQGVCVDGFLLKLLRLGIETVIDVRGNAVSRKYGFSKRTLNRLTKNVGIEYHHFPQLGVAPILRRKLERDADYQELWKIYHVDVLEKQLKARCELRRLLTGNASVLICYEANPKHCHRSRLAEVLSQDTGLRIQHI